MGKAIITDIYENIEEILLKSFPELLEKGEASIDSRKIQEIIYNSEKLLKLQSSLSSKREDKIRQLHSELRKAIKGQTGIIKVDNNILYQLRNNVYSLLELWELPIYDG